MISYWSVKAMVGGRKWPHKFKDMGAFPWEESNVRLPSEEEIRYWLLKYGKYVDENGRGYNA